MNLDNDDDFPALWLPTNYIIFKGWHLLSKVRGRSFDNIWLNACALKLMNTYSFRLKGIPWWFQAWAKFENDGHHSLKTSTGSTVKYLSECLRDIKLVMTFYPYQLCEQRNLSAQWISGILLTKQLFLKDNEWWI